MDLGWFASFEAQHRNGSRMLRNRHNSNVSKILPLTTFRTIDLGGRKISGPLFSIFWAETRVFLLWTAGSLRRANPGQPRAILMKAKHFKRAPAFTHDLRIRIAGGGEPA
jgi:hypothetical protein